MNAHVANVFGRFADELLGGGVSGVVGVIENARPGIGLLQTGNSLQQLRLTVVGYHGTTQNLTT